MSLHKPNEFRLAPCFCHICYEEVREDQHGIEHSGHGQMTQTKDRRFGPLHDFVEGHMTLWFHPECATVMALRLSHDVMKVESKKDQPQRVVDGLKSLAKVNLAR